MSIQAVGWVLNHERSTTAGERLVLLALANYADERGECYPSVKRVARDCNMSPRGVQYAIDKLVQAGLVERARQGANDPRIRADRRPNLYRLLLNGGVQPVHPAASTGCNLQQDGVQSDASRGEAQFTQTINEPSKNRGRRYFSPGAGWIEEAS